MATNDASAAMTVDPKATFDVVIRDLQGVVEQLERADMPLEEALRAFERGVSLSRRGQEILDFAERKIEILLGDGTTEPFEAARP